MGKTRLYLLNLLFLLPFNSNILCAQDSVIVGKAHNAKYGAVVVSSNDEVYYIDKLKSWSADFNEKNVRIVGKVVIKKLKKPDSISGTITEPEIKIIKKPKIQLLPDS